MAFALWYIALRAGKLEEAGERLKRFSYETRSTSKEFCKRLCESNFKLSDKPSYKEDISGFIKEQTWFKSEWEYDPTILSMLQMLSGTGQEDGIENEFKDCSFEDYWKELTKEDIVVFYCLPSEKLGQFKYDDIYIKMNARGKSLTNFEKFKADLVSYIEKQKDADWRNLEKTIPFKLDTDWTDIFWDHRSEKNEIDEIYFAFLNRFFLNYRIKKNAKEIIEESNAYISYFTDKNMKYKSLDNYKWNDCIDIDLFKDLEDVLNNYFDFQKKMKEKYEDRKKRLKKIKEIFQCPWGEPFEFIPSYSNRQNVIRVMSWRQRIVFYAVCKYFKKGNANEESLDQWMRFVWNMVYSYKFYLYEGKTKNDLDNIEDTVKSSIINIIRHINKINDSHNVYKQLQRKVDKKVKPEIDILSPERQFKEECEKACKILEDKKWEDKIKEAEKYSFFSGSIGFLYRNGKGEDTWVNFDKKFKNAKKYFNRKVNKESSCLNKKFDNANLLKALISRFSLKHFDGDNIDNILIGEENLFTNRAWAWQWYLLHPSICEPVHQLLCGNTSVEKLSKPDFESSGKDFYKENTRYLLSNTDLLDHIINDFKDTIIDYDKSHYVLYIKKGRKSYPVFLDAKKRDQFFIKNKDKIRILKKNDYPYTSKDVGKRFLFGEDIYFKYNNENNFVWRYDGRIFLQYKNNDVINQETGKPYFCDTRKNSVIKEWLNNPKNIKSRRR